MSNDYVGAKRPSIAIDFDSSSDTPSTPQSATRTSALSSKVTSVLAASYADLEIRNALALLDERSVVNSAETRRQLRLNVQKDVIESNGAIIREFGHVAEVGQPGSDVPRC
jgi:hypothetical protein